MSRYADVAAYILAGGASSRMGQDKGLIEIGGEPLVVWTAQLVRPLVDSVTVVGAPGTYRRFGLASIRDKVPGLSRVPAFAGPLAGIVTALSSSKRTWNLILACDLPYLSTEWINVLLARALKSGGQAFLPCTSRGMEPLAGVYRKDASEELARAFKEGVRKVTDALARISVETVSGEDFGNEDESGLALRNMNTPEDFREAKDWWAVKQSLKGAAIKDLKRQVVKKRRAVRRNK